MIQVKPHIAQMATYKPPWTQMDRKGYLRLDLNENTLGPPDHVKSALKAYIDDDRIQMYPDYYAFLGLLSRYTHRPADQLIVTNGSDQAIEIVLRAFLGKEDEMVMAQPGFPMFNQIAGVIGAKVKAVPYGRNMQFPHDTYHQAITSQTRLLVLINPDNPTGVAIPLEIILEILDTYPNLPVIVDEAYFEFTGKTALAYLDNHPNMILLRTFSKAFAMAGLRLGYIIAHPEIISQLYKIRGPFDVNVCALVAASAQLTHDIHWKAYIKEVMTKAKPMVEDFFRQRGVEFYPGAANFMLVRPKHRDQAVDFLKTHGILVRPMYAPSIEDTFRMSIGTADQMARFVDVYDQYLNEVD